jgi:hypothetical protein
MHLLKKYGSQLAQNGNRKFIDDITKILSVYSEYDFNMIKQKYETNRIIHTTDMPVAGLSERRRDNSRNRI